ncbi:MAG: hypothetical protein GF329_06695 [Candidatus Lokiarchaeota archaeon]|nr:hypothetical protein [Candidatus Lokiarchaeota archaeon]
MTQYTLGDIPDSVKSKQYLGLTPHLYRVFKHVGWDYYKKGMEGIEGAVNSLLSIRMKEGIEVSKQTVSGELKNPEKTVCYMLHPSIVPCRADLMVGTMKLLYGESVDVSFILIDDDSQEIAFIVNSHLEDGIPVDFFIIERNDEILDRRHMRLGYKLRDIPKKTKNLNKCGQAAIDILKDIRNERTPQWSESTYLTAESWISCAINIIIECTAYQTHGLFWDGVNAKRRYKLGDDYCRFYPYPPLLNTLFMMQRPQFISRAAGLFNGHNMLIKGVHETPLKWVKDNFIEAFDLGIRYQLEEAGINLPIVNTNTKVNLDVKKGWEFPKGTKVTIEELGIDSVDKALEGVLLDVNHDTPADAKIGERNIISTGWGLRTKFKK